MSLSIFSAPGAEPLAVLLDLPAFTFEARPVVPVMDAARVELETIALRDGHCQISFTEFSVPFMA